MPKSGSLVRPKRRPTEVGTWSCTNRPNKGYQSSSEGLLLKAEKQAFSQRPCTTSTDTGDYPQTLLKTPNWRRTWMSSTAGFIASVHTPHPLPHRTTNCPYLHSFPSTTCYEYLWRGYVSALPETKERDSSRPQRPLTLPSAIRCDTDLQQITGASRSPLQYSRPIALTSVVVKSFERLILANLERYHRCPAGPP